VRGSIWPAQEPVQVFVLTGRKWLPQQLPTRDGALWSARCRFETAPGTNDSAFKIAAISRATLVVGPVRRLPWWSTTTSRIVRVTRREGAIDGSRGHGDAEIRKPAAQVGHDAI
jgi:hypothetical protein